MKNIQKIFLTVLILNGLIYSQDNPSWVSRYNGTANGIDEVSALVVDNSGNVFVTGRSQGSTSNYDYLTIKYNPSGDTVWVRRYNGPGNHLDEAKDIAVDIYGNVYVIGLSVGTNNYADIATIKYNMGGDVVWISRYNSPADHNDNGYGIALDEFQNVYVTGSSYFGTSEYDYITVKYNSSGTYLTSARYNGTGNHTDAAMEINYRSGNIYVTGTSRNTYNSSTSADIVTIRYNSSLDSVWVKRYNGPANNYDEPRDITSDASGNVYVTGFTRNSAPDESADYVTIKYSPSGDSLWVKKYNGPGSSQDESNSVAVDNSGNVYVTGFSIGTISGHDYATIKYSSLGSELWVQRYNGTQPSPPSLDQAKSLAIDTFGNIFVTGFSQGYGSQSDYVTICYNPSGVQQWLHRYNGTDNNADAAYCIAVDGSGYVYVTGNSMNTGMNIDYTTIKYDKIIGVENISQETPDKFRLYQNYPNPFNPSTKIRFSTPLNPPFDKGGTVRSTGGFVTLKVYDVLGREVATLVNDKLMPGTYEVDWSATGEADKYSSGVYFYRLISADYSETKRMVLIK